MTKQEMIDLMEEAALKECYAALPAYSLFPYEMVKGIRQYAESTARAGKKPEEMSENVIFSQEIINGPDGDDLELRIYQPANRSLKLPAILYCHGGGCVLGSALQDDSVCVAMAEKENAVVININYRLAPDHPAPAGQTDFITAWEWVLSTGYERYNIDTERVVFYGGSGGANIILGATLRLVDNGKKLPAAIMPLFPMIDDRGITDSSLQITDNSIWGREQNLQAWSYYIYGLAEKDDREVDCYTAPARRESFCGLPRTFTYVGTLDQFRDETIEMVRKMGRDLVSIDFTLYPGCFHGFDVYCENEAAKRAKRSEHEFMQKVFSV